jgi:hypothetical protein
MIGIELLRDVARGVNELRAKVSSPQFIQRDVIEVRLRCSTLDTLMSDERGESKTVKPLRLFGLPVECDSGIPADTIRLIEQRSQRSVDVKVR